MRRSDLVRALAKFDGTELQQLRRHVSLVEILSRRSFLRTEMTWKLSLRDPRVRAPTSSEEALDAALPYVRQLWRDDEYGGFHRVKHIIGQHALNCSEGDHVKRLMRRARQEHAAILKQGRFGYLLDDDGMVVPGRVFEAWVHGHLAHGNDRHRFDDILAAWTEGHHLVLAEVTTELARFYRQFAVGAYAITMEPALHE